MIRLLMAGLFAAATLPLSAQVKKPSPAAAKTATTQPKAEKERMVQITTNYGTMVLKLYNSTPLHRDNFVRLVKNKFYDSLLFHRVIEGFMIQGGDPTSRNASADAVLGSGSEPGTERIPAEFKPELMHKKGALAAARDNNPEKASSNCQFYIVQGRPGSDAELNNQECNLRQQGNMNFYYNDAQRKLYKANGGTPFLDQNYTVFGEVVKGLEVIDKIAAVQKGQNDRPAQNVLMTIKMLN